MATCCYFLDVPQDGAKGPTAERKDLGAEDLEVVLGLATGQGFWTLMGGRGRLLVFIPGRAQLTWQR